MLTCIHKHAHYMYSIYYHHHYYYVIISNLSLLLHSFGTGASRGGNITINTYIPI